MQLKLVKASKTKPSKVSTRVLKHTWEFDFDGCSPEQVADLACDGLVIRNQGLLRADCKAGRPIRFPEGQVKVKVSDVIAGLGVSMQPPTLESVLAMAKTDANFAKMLVEALKGAVETDTDEE